MNYLDTLRAAGSNSQKPLPAILQEPQKALNAEPFERGAKPPEATMTLGEERRIGAWLVSIEETDAEIIAEVLALCRRDADARAYFLARSEEAPRQDDDRRHCRT